MASKAIRRNATNMIAKFQRTHTDVAVYTLENYFHGEKVTDAAWPWDRWAKSHHATARIDDDGTITISLHSNCWFKLAKPKAGA